MKKTPNAQRPTSNVELGLPIVVDPFSRAGDEVAGATADEIALNLWESVQISRRYRQTLHQAPPDLRGLFRGHKLSLAAKSALREADAVIASASSATSAVSKKFRLRKNPIRPPAGAPQ